MGNHKQQITAIKKEVPATDRVPELDKQPSSLVETIIKFAGFAGMVSAAMGLPAVYLYFYNFGIPSHYIDYQLILSAGILPTILLSMISLYIRSILQKYYKNEKTSPLQNIIFLPFILPVLPVLTIGIFAHIILTLWCISWLFTLPLQLLQLNHFTNREILYTAFALGGFIIFLYVIQRLFLKSKPLKWIAVLLGISLQENKNHPHKSGKKQNVIRPKIHVDAKETDELQAKEWLRILPIIYVIFPVIIVGFLFSIKAVLFFWDAPLGNALLPEIILWLGIGVGLIYGLCISSIAWTDFFSCESRSMKFIGLAIAICSLLIFGSFSVVLYATEIYPAISQAFGGGKPEKVTIWIDPEDIPSVAEMSAQLPGIRIEKPKNDLAKLGPVSAIRTSKVIFIFPDSKPTSKGVALDLEKLKMVAWGDR